jgi:hypothetical protein
MIIKSPKVVFVLAMLMAALAVALTTTPSDQKGSFLSGEDDEDRSMVKAQEPTSLEGPSRRFLALNYDRYVNFDRNVNFDRYRYVWTCDKNPWVCSAVGSGGPDCCMKWCVNVTTNIFNCGKCGKPCRFSEICCDGQCVNPMSNKLHCGRCNNKCKKGSACAYGMCNYA